MNDEEIQAMSETPEKPERSKEKYDPRQEYLDRRTPAKKARDSRISQSQFADSHGGDSSNYRK